jgi:predicted nucleic acid-binding protein
VALIVFDASVVIAHRDRNDVHHMAAEKALAAVVADDLRLPASAYSEVLVGPTSRGRAQRVREEIQALALRVEPITEEIAERAAALRARHRGLRLPDALVLGCAEVLGADAVVTADRGWRRYSRRISVIG